MSANLVQLVLNNVKLGYTSNPDVIKMASALCGKAVIVRPCVAGYKPDTDVALLAARCSAIGTHSAVTPAQGKELADAWMTLAEYAKTVSVQPVRAVAKPGKFVFKDEPGKEYCFSEAKRHAASTHKCFTRKA